MGIDGGGDADVGVAEEFLDHDEFDALFQEQGGGGVAEVVEADAAKPRPAEESAEAPSQVGGIEGAASRGGEDARGVRGDPGADCEGLLTRGRRTRSRPTGRRSARGAHGSGTPPPLLSDGRPAPR
ncbi:hypothetical protein GCM10010129_62000 [Streptomyces fumigatiscleroticus]|nr:hypothetical protein GCM10010129_62000 [Streptomyces fumigatiscleroticus]